MSRFSLSSPAGKFDLTPDYDCMVVYVHKNRKTDLPKVAISEIPSWCFDPETIWFYFGANESEDKVAAGERIKTSLQENRLS